MSFPLSFIAGIHSSPTSSIRCMPSILDQSAMEDLLSPRQAPNTCYGGKQWYVCSAGNFHGCCSSDPCSTGICADDDESTTSISSIPTGTTPSPTSAEVSPAAFSTSDGVTGNPTTSPTSTAVTTPISTGAESPHKGVLIGGIVGAISGLILMAALIWFCWRRRQLYNVVNMHRSVSAQSFHDAKTFSPAKSSPSTPATNMPLLNGEHQNRTEHSISSHSLKPGLGFSLPFSSPDSWTLSIPGSTLSPGSTRSTTTDDPTHQQ